MSIDLSMFCNRILRPLVCCEEAGFGRGAGTHVTLGLQPYLVQMFRFTIG